MTTTQFTQHYRDTYPPLFSFVLRMAKNQAVAEDVCSRSMMKAWEHRDELNGNFKSWVYQIAANEMKEYWRHESCIWMEPLGEDHQEIPDPRDFTAALERCQEIQRAESIMQSMERRERQALRCHLIGNSIEESAFLLGVCEGTAGRRIWEAKRKAKELCAA
jgi:RNA polymerase sigma-70 factor (ECF subfamily)